MSDLRDLKAVIVNQIPIVQIVGNYITITKKGHQALAICPFHQDSKPSLNVTNEKKMFKCFACGEGGNAIDFVMKYKGVTFIEALEEISKIIGVSFDDYSKKKKKSPRLVMAEKLLVKTTQLFCKFSETIGKEAFSKFIETRGLNQDIAATYRLGFAPKSNALINYLSSIPSDSDKKLAIDVALEIGLIKNDQKRKGEHYDTFRDRIIFPIWDQFGQPIAFTSRSIHDYQKPKYLNLKESFVFSKKSLLYGLHLAKNSIRQKDFAIIVEGNMDQIALYSKGFTNSVAIMGVALGDQSLSRLMSLTKNFILALDSDDAGLKAAERINKQCMEQGITPKFLHFGDAKDPDEFLNQNGALALQKKIDEAEVFLDYQLKNLLPKELPTLVDKKLQLFESSFSIIAPLKNSLQASERVLLVASRIGLQTTTEVILNKYKEYLDLQKKNSHFSPPVQENIDSSQESYYLDYNEDNLMPSDLDLSLDQEKIEKVDIEKSEILFLQEVVQYPEVLTHQNFSEVLDFVRSPEVKQYVLRLKEIVYEIEESEYLSVITRITQKESFDQRLKDSVLQGLKVHKPKNLDEKTISKLLNENKRKLEFGQLLIEKEALKKEKVYCQTETEMNTYMKKLLIIEQNLNKLKSPKNL